MEGGASGLKSCGEGQRRRVAGMGVECGEGLRFKWHVARASRLSWYVARAALAEMFQRLMMSISKAEATTCRQAR